MEQDRPRHRQRAQQEPWREKAHGPRSPRSRMAISGLGSTNPVSMDELTRNKYAYFGPESTGDLA
jgi:hypothetical protein